MKYHKKRQKTEPVNSSIRNNFPFFLNHKILIGILILTTFIVYIPVLKAGFVTWDDLGYLTENKNLLENFSLVDIFSQFAVMGNYHPLTITVYALIFKFFGMSALAFHLLNIILHIANTILVFKLIRLILPNENFVAFVTALLFGIHPLHVESVAWISELKDVLYSFFYLLGIIFWIKYKNNKTKSLILYFFVFTLFIFACLSKAMAVTFPFFLILIDFYKYKKNIIFNIVDKIPFILVGLIIGIIAIYAQKASSAILDMQEYAMFEKILFPIYSIMFYIIKTILPLNLSIFYSYPKTGELSLWFYLAPLGLILLMFIISKLLKKNKLLAFCLLLYLFMIFPVIQIKPVGNAITADRYFYISSIGLLLLLSLAFNAIMAINNKLKIYFTIFFSIICLIFGFVSFERTKIWNNSSALWASVIKTHPQTDIAWYGIAREYDINGQMDLAFKNYKKALEINPLNVKANINIGNIFYNKLQLDSAKYYYLQALNNNNQNEKVYYNLGNISFAQNNLDDAINLYHKAIEINPRFVLTYNQLSNCYRKKGEIEKADYYLQLSLKK